MKKNTSRTLSDDISINISEGIKIMHCADVHLCSEFTFLKSNAKSRRAELLATFQNMVALCKSKAIVLLIISGDLFDSNHADVSVVDEVKKIFASVPDTIIAVAAGNHDYYAVDSPYADEDWPDNVHIFKGELSSVEFAKKKLRIWGKSFVSSYSPKPNDKLPDIPDDGFINIMIMHGDLVSDGQSSVYNPVTRSFIENSRMDYIALGHIHKRTEILKAGKTFYAYCGSPEPLGFDEPGEKGCYIGRVYKNDCKLNFQKTCKRMVAEVEVDISGLNSNKQISDAVFKKLQYIYGASYDNNMYRIILQGKLDVHFTPDCALIENRLAEKIYSIRIKNEAIPDIPLERLAGEISLKGIFVKKMLEKINHASDEEARKKLEQALYIGLKAFDGEVSYYENQ